MGYKLETANQTIIIKSLKQNVYEEIFYSYRSRCNDFGS